MNQENDFVILKVDNVAKQYKLGQIGGTTLRAELQRKKAKLLGREDPTRRIGAVQYKKGETFMALDGVSFEVKKGERVGIIGHNGAGKSTLLKLVSRVTAPTGGEIGLNGRVASMLEVGTGFHGELTGRENIYMNGAILGMTKKEIDSKIEDIIEFSECRQFIDTPVKRYSSGMYVKLAFSVAAHLDSEIMIMDEVLAVGDMAFQKKCLDKMNEVSRQYGRTILYVSHNMNTIRQLCNRVIVLSHGKVIYDGDVEGGISLYMGESFDVTEIDYTKIPRKDWVINLPPAVWTTYAGFIESSGRYEFGHHMKLKLGWTNAIDVKDISLRIEIVPSTGNAVGTAFIYQFYSGNAGESHTVNLDVDISNLAPGHYNTRYVFFNYVPGGAGLIYDCVDGLPFSVDGMHIKWDTNSWGNTVFPDIIAF